MAEKVAVTQSVSPESLPRRVDSMDLLRGAVMVLMALDHTRDFFTNLVFDPADLQQTHAALFVTRWVTHFCAPVFVFLAGMGAYLYGSRGRSRSQLASFLLSRGLWLVVLEFTLVHFGWYFNFKYPALHGGVIWAIGWSMILLAGLAFLPTGAVVFLGVVLVFGHNLLDLVWQPPGEPPFWMVAGQLRMGVLYRFGTAVDSTVLHVAYPVLPWLGVMCLGYGTGWLWVSSPHRRLWLGGMGLAGIVLFVGVRMVNGYGDPWPWEPQSSALFTLFSFVNCTKYPPSLDYVLMTLGPALVFLASISHLPGWFGKVLVTFGRVPLFYYLLHLPLIHLVAMVVARVEYGHAGFMFNHPLSQARFEVFPEDYGTGLIGVYAAWLTVLAMLYPVCWWFEGVKRRSKSVWLSYL